MMQEVIPAMQTSGTKVFTFAPSADASRVTLREKGFANSDTVSRLLIDAKLHEQICGEAIWIDEAGLVGVRTMSKVFDLAKKLDARVILSGDRRQHGSVEAGAALRLLEEEAGIKPAEIKEIQRQTDEQYKKVIEHLSEGRIDKGFEALWTSSNGSGKFRMLK
jgi:ATP-dependent exoDNAse (exonuclease V) alpha subunit